MDKNSLESWARGHDVRYASFDELCADNRSRAMVLDELNIIAKKRLGSNEKLAKVALLPGHSEAGDEAGISKQPWTVENGCLTAR